MHGSLINTTAIDSLTMLKSLTTTVVGVIVAWHHLELLGTMCRKARLKNVQLVRIHLALTLFFLRSKAK